MLAEPEDTHISDEQDKLVIEKIMAESCKTSPFKTSA
jgi:hypothetical protein